MCSVILLRGLLLGVWVDMKLGICRGKDLGAAARRWRLALHAGEREKPQADVPFPCPPLPPGSDRL